jgi:hypothetical protein
MNRHAANMPEKLSHTLCDQRYASHDTVIMPLMRCLDRRQGITIEEGGESSARSASLNNLRPKMTGI